MPETDVKRSLLLVDDNEVHLTFTGGMLKGNYDIITANSGKEALGLLIKGVVPDLILLDIVMPNMDGWETYNRIRGISLLRDVPIAFFSSLEGENVVQQAADMGAADFIPKSCGKDEFLTRIASIITKYEAK
ncbi:MAG: response regulator [Treponema sp.]|jgi:putative two-component system response regulator|nr:response regulator [Treponema sp.]